MRGERFIRWTVALSAVFPLSGFYLTIVPTKLRKDLGQLELSAKRS